jgi:hypothetical protein
MSIYHGAEMALCEEHFKEHMPTSYVEGYVLGFASKLRAPVTRFELSPRFKVPSVGSRKEYARLFLFESLPGKIIYGKVSLHVRYVGGDPFTSMSFTFSPRCDDTVVSIPLAARDQKEISAFSGEILKKISALKESGYLESERALFAMRKIG